MFAAAFLGTLFGAASADTALAEGWATAAPMPTPRYLLAAAAIDGKLYAVGGINNGDQNALEVYDPATNSWTAREPMPTTRH